jgi:hypothetical protein
MKYHQKGNDDDHRDQNRIQKNQTRFLLYFLCQKIDDDGKGNNYQLVLKYSIHRKTIIFSSMQNREAFRGKWSVFSVQ